MNWKKLLESSAESANDELRLRNAYLVAENGILRNQINGRVNLTDSERKKLAEIGAKLGRQALEEIATIAQSDTIPAWNRKFANSKMDTCMPPKSVGRSPRGSRDRSLGDPHGPRESLVGLSHPRVSKPSGLYDQ
jgi:hypothetical protein